MAYKVKKLFVYGLLVLLVVSQLLFSMDTQEAEITSNGLSLVIYNKPLYFHHDVICSLALIDKRNQKAIQDTAIQRKKHLDLLNPHNCIFSALQEFPLTWHKYGSMCAAPVKTLCNENGKSLIRLELCSFVYNGYSITTMRSKNFVLDGQASAGCRLLYDRVKIDSEGGIFCHGLSKHNDTTLGPKDYHVVECSYFRNQKAYERRCAIRIKKNSKDYVLSYLIPFPALLKAFLHAPVAQQADECKFYDLSGAVIPDNYQEVDKDFASLHSFHKSLPKELRKAIIKQYERQKTKIK